MDLDQNNKKIICLGWHKTGTSTIGDALLILGYSVTGARLDLADSLLKGNTKQAIQIASQFQVLQDVPWVAMYKELDKAFPNSKYILTVRDEQSWLMSAKKHFKNKHTKMRKWLYGYGNINGNEEIYLKRYRRHYDEVKTYFANRPNDIIIMDFKAGDEWEKLCNFLNKPIPSKSFPHSNKGIHNYTSKDKAYHFLKTLTPNWLRVLRIKILIKMGHPDKRDRFNNAYHNRKSKN